jgi:hypothetical protein
MSIHQKDAVDNLKRDGKQTVHKATSEAKQAAYSPWVVRLTRLGYVARGLIYLTVGVMAVLVANGGFSQVPDYTGAIATLGKTQYGYFLLILILVGLVGYSLWGFIRAILDPLHKGDDTKGLITRAGYLSSAVTYGLLAVPTWQVLYNHRNMATSGTQTSQSQQVAATLLTQPFGKWIVLAVGVVIFGAGIYQLYLALQKNFEKYYSAFKLNSEEKRWLDRAGRFGTAARGVALGLVGIFFIQAALYVNPSKVKGIDGAFQFLAHQPGGAWLMLIVALGFVAFGVYSVVEGLLFRMPRG